MIYPPLFRKDLKELRNQPAHRGVDDSEIRCESEDGNDYNRCGGADLLPGRPGNPAHFLLQFLKVTLRLRRPLTSAFHPAIRFH